MPERNVIGSDLQPCSVDPITGWFRDGTCETAPEDLGSHTICAVVTNEFLEHQRTVGNDLITPMPEYQFPGLKPGDRWCVTARNWLRAHRDGVAAPVVLASTHERALQIVPLEVLQEQAVDVPDDPGILET
ncbi:MAG: DUF2237 domain-containing protein [Acidobacteria bacterium]|nr:DUF2237 domain-containing protein [Acidobacteriota bacterium]